MTADCLKMYEQILMKFSGNVDHGPRKSSLIIGDVLDSGGPLTYDQSQGDNKAK